MSDVGVGVRFHAPGSRRRCGSRWRKGREGLQLVFAGERGVLIDVHAHDDAIARLGLLRGLLAAGPALRSTAPNRASSTTIRSRASRTPRTPRRSQAWDIDLIVDLATNLFGTPGDPTPDVRAQNINTIDEVPDSNWFTNRILAQPGDVRTSSSAAR